MTGMNIHRFRRRAGGGEVQFSKRAPNRSYRTAGAGADPNGLSVSRCRMMTTAPVRTDSKPWTNTTNIQNRMGRWAVNHPGSFEVCYKKGN
jgi:hypothetical protein